MGPGTHGSLGASDRCRGLGLQRPLVVACCAAPGEGHPHRLTLGVPLTSGGAAGGRRGSFSAPTSCSPRPYAPQPSLHPTNPTHSNTPSPPFPPPSRMQDSPELSPPLGDWLSCCPVRCHLWARTKDAPFQTVPCRPTPQPIFQGDLPLPSRAAGLRPGLHSCVYPWHWAWAGRDRCMDMALSIQQAVSGACDY